MLDLRLRYQGGGRFQAATKLDFDLAEAQVEREVLLRAKISHPRSLRQNAYFHALIEAAYDNQRGGPKVADWRHLKAWLLIQIGHCEEHRFKRGALTPEVAKLLRQKVDTVETNVNKRTGEIVLRFAKPTRDLSSEEMSELVDKVVALICTKIVPGMDPESILNMAKSKAA